MTSVQDTITDERKLVEIVESNFLDLDEIAMVYDEKKDIILSPMFLSLPNLMNSLKLKYSGRVEIGKNEYFELYRDEYNNTVFLKYKIDIIPLIGKNEEGKAEIIVDKVSLYVYPMAWICNYNNPRPEEVDLKFFVESHKKNVLGRVVDNILDIFMKLDGEKTVSTKNPTYIA